MHRRAVIAPALVLLAGCFSTAVFAATADDFKAAFAKAETAEQQAGALKNQWTTTESTLRAAQAAAAAGNYHEAVTHAQFAEELAKASIAQAREQATAWKSAVIH